MQEHELAWLNRTIQPPICAKRLVHRFLLAYDYLAFIIVV